MNLMKLERCEKNFVEEQKENFNVDGKSQIDLHGLRYDEAEKRIEDFFLLNRSPYRIVTGNSFKMKKIVIEMAEKYGLECFYENFNNVGSLIVVEKIN